MATTFKSLSNNDITTTRTLLHEQIPISGTIISGTYLTSDKITEENIKNYAHGMFQSVYDYPYLSSSANHIFDITCGYAGPHSSLSQSATGTTTTQQSKKINVYNQMAQVLMGYDSNGNIQRFDQDGDLSAGGKKIDEAFFVNFSRLLTKDEIKKGSFVISMYTGSDGSEGSNPPPHQGNLPAAEVLTIGDYGAATDYKVNSPAGEYGVLYTGSTSHNAGAGVGLIFYQAGIAVLTASIFSADPIGQGDLTDLGTKRYCDFGRPDSGSYVSSVTASLTGASIQQNADGFRNRWVNCEFNNTTELNSTIYFCRAHHNEFNYSSNPTYLNSSKIRVKGDNPQAEPVSYITTIGLYSNDNELLAVAKLSEPLKKSPSNELTLRVRLDY